MWISIGNAFAPFFDNRNFRVQGERMMENNWRELCATIIAEKDPERLLALVHELNEVLERPKGNRQASNYCERVESF
jgi:hypothetical protein